MVFKRWSIYLLDLDAVPGYHQMNERKSLRMNDTVNVAVISRWWRNQTPQALNKVYRGGGVIYIQIERERERERIMVQDKLRQMASKRHIEITGGWISQGESEWVPLGIILADSPSRQQRRTQPDNFLNGYYLREMASCCNNKTTWKITLLLFLYCFPTISFFLSSSPHPLPWRRGKRPCKSPNSGSGP